MQPTRKSHLTRLVLKLASVAVAIAAVAVGVQAQDTPLDRMSAVNQQARVAVPVASTAPLVVQASDVWYADDSATGARPDASH